MLALAKELHGSAPFWVTDTEPDILAAARGNREESQPNEENKHAAH